MKLLEYKFKINPKKVSKLCLSKQMQFPTSLFIEEL